MPNQNALKVACKRGHPFDVTNTYRQTLANGRVQRYCRLCRNQRTYATKAKYWDRYLTQMRQWYASNPKKVRAHHLFKRYRITPEEYDRRLIEQGGLCAICRTAVPRDVDHNHSTKQVRSLLCHRCNTFVGFVETGGQFMAKIISYLEHWNSK